MQETHPFGDFVPQGIRYLLLGSFTGKRTEEDIKNGYDWYYGTKRNQLWKILEKVYETKLENKKNKQDLFKSIGMGIADIILSCERKMGSNLDNNLVNIIFNDEGINSIFAKNKIEKIYFSSKFVEKLFLKNFKNLTEKYPDLKLVALPSPSPRYAAITKEEKIKKYKSLFPRFPPVLEKGDITF